MIKRQQRCHCILCEYLSCRKVLLTYQYKIDKKPKLTENMSKNEETDRGNKHKKIDVIKKTKWKSYAIKAFLGFLSSVNQVNYWWKNNNNNNNNNNNKKNYNPHHLGKFVSLPILTNVVDERRRQQGPNSTEQDGHWFSLKIKYNSKTSQTFFKYIFG